MLTIPTVVAVILTALSLCICVCWSRDNPLTVALKVIYLGLTVWGFVASLALASGGSSFPHLRLRDLPHPRFRGFFHPHEGG